MKISDLKSVALFLLKEGYTYSEAYPIHLSKKNKIPELTKKEHEIVDTFIKLERLCSDYERTEK